MTSGNRFAAVLSVAMGSALAASAGAQADKSTRVEPKEFTNSIGMKLMPIKPGEFTMGDAVLHDAKLLHRVRITKSFYMSAHLVTQFQYRKVTGANPSHFKDDESSLPVHQVSWEDANAFCGKLNSDPEEKRAGRTYRLPTEAEWEYCCRAGTKTKFWFGDEITPDHANFDASRIGRTTPVNRYKANPWGLHDMHGNLFQWCRDGYDHDFFAKSPESDPVNVDGADRVLRGAGWGFGPGTCRSGHRNRAAPTVRYPSIGFRVVCVTE